MDEIAVGSIVKLSGNFYKVATVGVKDGRVYPQSVWSVSSTTHEMTAGRSPILGNPSWATYGWVLVANGKLVDPKEKIFAKIRYLDEKFKKAQAEKKAAKEKPPVNTSKDAVAGVRFATQVEAELSQAYLRDHYQRIREYMARIDATGSEFVTTNTTASAAYRTIRGE